MNHPKKDKESGVEKHKNTKNWLVVVTKLGYSVPK